MLAGKKSIAIKGAAVIAAIMTFIACGSESSKEENVSTSETADTIVTEPKTNDISYILPSPLQIASVFKKSGLEYKSGITSTIKDPSKYTNIIDKSFNLGVYSSDLAYSVLNKQNQEAMTYMKLSRKLADDIGIGSVFDQANLAQRFEKNISNEDSLAYIIAELQMATDMYLDENEQQHITSIIFSGAWIESMYIASKVYENTKDKTLNNKLSEQMIMLGSIINALKVGEKKDASISTLIAEIQSIKDSYDAMPSVKNNQEIADGSEKEIVLTDKEVAELAAKIAVLRTKFING